MDLMKLSLESLGIRKTRIMLHCKKSPMRTKKKGHNQNFYIDSNPVNEKPNHVSIEYGHWTKFIY